MGLNPKERVQLKNLLEKEKNYQPLTEEDLTRMELDAEKDYNGMLTKMKMLHETWNWFVIWNQRLSLDNISLIAEVRHLRKKFNQEIESGS